MPSFVPSLTLDVRTNWFSLAHPTATEQTMRQTMHLSRSVQAMRHHACQCQQCAHLYRPGEFARLMRRVDQLDRRLPLQTLAAQIPYENTCGGFELFNTGITDLAPELVGWYGAPGVDPDGPTTLFLIGKGFSLHDTTILAGGRPVAATLISREVLKAEIPAGVAVMPAAPACSPAAPCLGHVRRGVVRPVAAVEPLPAPPETISDGPVFADQACTAGCVACNDREVVDIHLATPYGVSGHLLIPVARRQLSMSCSLVLTPGFDVQLTFSTSRSATAKADVARVDEYFTASRDAIVIDTPSAFVPPAKAELPFLLRDAATGKTAATFSFGDLPYDAARRAYVIAGGPLRNLIGDTSRPATDKTLRGAVKPWLDNTLAGGGLTTDGDIAPGTLTATLVAGQQEIPIGGSIGVAAARRGKTAEE